MGLITTTRGDWAAWVGTYDDLLKGGAGQYRLRLMRNTKGFDSSYPGLEVLPDGTLVTTTYGHWTKDEPPYIVSVISHRSTLILKRVPLRTICRPSR